MTRILISLPFLLAGGAGSSVSNTRKQATNCSSWPFCKKSSTAVAGSSAKWSRGLGSNGRTDIAIFWKKQVVAVELKIHRHERSREEGLDQLGRYLDKLGQPHGYLVLFDKRPSAELPWEERIRWTEEERAGKRITVVEL